MNLFASIRRNVSADVRRLRRQNPALAAALEPWWLRWMRPLLANRSLFGLARAYLLIWAVLILAGALLTLPTPAALDTLVADYGRPETIRNLLSYMLGAQATMVGLIFPLALGMVTLIVTRDEGTGTNADVQLYYDQSLAYAVGTSGLTLAIALVIGLFAPEMLVLDLIGRAAVAWSVSLGLLVVLAAWLLLNLLLTWQFLITSLSFIAPGYRAEARKRFVAARIIPGHLVRLLSEYATVQLSDTLALGQGKAMPMVMAGTAEVGLGERAVVARFERVRQLIDIRLRPLRLAVRLWAWRCRRAGEGPGAGAYRWMLGLAGPIGRDLHGDVQLCRRIGGVPLNGIERWLIRHSLVFAPFVEQDRLTPTDILKELGDKVVLQLDRLALSGFQHALREMREFHAFLLRAHTIIGEDGVASSYAQYGSMFAEQSNWTRAYARLIERAVANIEREDDFLGSLAYVAPNLIPDPKDRVPPRTAASPYEIPEYMVHRVGRWLTGQRAPRGTGLRALMPGALPDQLTRTYRSVAMRMVGASEAALQAGARYAQAPEGATDDAHWAALVHGWPLLFRHLATSAYVLAASYWHEDDIGAPLYMESLLEWRRRLHDLAEEDGRHVLQTALLGCELVDLDWSAVRALTEPLLLHPDFREGSPATIFGAVLANLHADVRTVTALILAGWAVSPSSVFEAAQAARQLAAAPGGGNGALDLVRSFVRLRLPEWSGKPSEYVGALDSLVQRTDAMTEAERVAGRFYSLDTRFRVGALSPDWFALVAALGDDAAFTAIENWLGALGADESAARMGEDVLWQVQAWLTRTAERWKEPEAGASLSEAIGVLNPTRFPQPAGDALYAALVAAAAAINRHCARRLAALPIAPVATEAFHAAIGAELGALNRRLGLFPRVKVAFAVGKRGRAPFEVSGVDKAVLIERPGKKYDAAYARRYARGFAAHVAQQVWRPYRKLRRRRVAVRSLREMFDAAALEGAKIAATGARPIVLLGCAGGDWPDLFDARGEMGDAVIQREADGLPATYLYSYAGVDFHRSQSERTELFGDDLLLEVSLIGRDATRPVEMAFEPEADPTDVTVTARVDVKASWRDAEVVVLARRARR
ncbi:hypothetical protein [Sphingomonas sp. OTU376]|uniref:hypothetical protein n=1 Tax=Sphingomonas sp. OTU376 TaxID=3043863 RepID=UPI00313F1893